jgi:hypothetical protein
MYVSINKRPRSPESLRLYQGRIQRRFMGSDVVPREGRLRTRVVVCQQPLSQVLFCLGQTRFETYVWRLVQCLQQIQVMFATCPSVSFWTLDLIL